MANETTGFVVLANDDAGAIYAVGATREAARADYQDATGEEFGTHSEYLQVATQRLIDAVTKNGGGPRDVRWGVVDGVADLCADAADDE